jgi:large subunit ribosomal protein L15
MADRKKSSKAASTRKAPAKKAAAPRKAAPAKAPSAKAAPAKAAPAKRAAPIASGAGLAVPGADVLMLATLAPNGGSRPKRTRVGRGHGSGMVKTSGKGGKGQTVRSGRGKGPAFEGGQTPWARRLPHRLGYSQKARDIGHFRSTFAVINLADLADWDASLEVTPQALKAQGKLKKLRDGVKILGGTKDGKTLPKGLVFRDVLFSQSARDALSAAGAKFEDAEG